MVSAESRPREAGPQRCSHVLKGRPTSAGASAKTSSSGSSARAVSARPHLRQPTLQLPDPCAVATSLLANPSHRHVTTSPRPFPHSPAVPGIYPASTQHHPIMLILATSPGDFPLSPAAPAWQSPPYCSLKPRVLYRLSRANSRLGLWSRAQSPDCALLGHFDMSSITRAMLCPTIAAIVLRGSTQHYHRPPSPSLRHAAGRLPFRPIPANGIHSWSVIQR
jgi:hypothetical protein